MKSIHICVAVAVQFNSYVKSDAVLKKATEWKQHFLQLFLNQMRSVLIHYYSSLIRSQQTHCFLIPESNQQLIIDCLEVLQDAFNNKESLPMQQHLSEKSIVPCFKIGNIIIFHAWRIERIITKSTTLFGYFLIACSFHTTPLHELTSCKVRSCVFVKKHKK